MDLDEVRAFLAVAHAGSFQAGARQLQWPRATVRRRVESLESRVGKPLFHRDTSGIRLTDTGRTVAARGDKVLREASALLASAREDAEPSGELRCAIPVGIPPQLHAGLVSAMMARYPLVTWTFRLCEDPWSVPLDELDIVAHLGPTTAPPGWSSLVTATVDERMLASPAYLEEHGTPASVGELALHRLIALKVGPAPVSTWPMLDGGEFEIEPIYVGPGIAHAFELAAAGAGIALVPWVPMVGASLGRESLTTVLGDTVGRQRVFYLSTPDAMLDVPKVRAMWNTVRGLVGETDDTL